MKILKLILPVIVTMSLSSAATAEQIDVWLGTTTPRGGLSKGIYHARLNTDNGKITRANLVAEITSPGFICMDPSSRFLYSTGNQNGKPSVSAYAIEGTGNEKSLRLLNSVEIGDGGSAHVSVDRSGKALLSAQYGGGSTAIFQLADDGSIVKRTGLHKHSGGSGHVKGRQDKPHAHWTGTSPDNKFVFVPDLGMDKVVIWKLDPKNATLSEHGFGICPAGGGPRHMKFSVDGKYVYVLNELALSVTVFQYNAADASMTAIQTVPTLSEEVKAKENFNSASEIRVHPSGKFVYSANRGNDTITAFKVEPSSGKLSVIEVEPIRGGWPRSFAIDPSGKWLLAAGRDSNTVAVFQINPENGQLMYTRNVSMVPSPICVLMQRFSMGESVFVGQHDLATLPFA